MNEEIVDKVKVFSSNDEKLKILGELLSNKTSRDIIRLLIENEMYANEIAKKLDLRPNLVTHHLRKLAELGLLEIKNKKIIKKGNEHRYYRIIPNLLLFPGESKEYLKSNGTLKKFFKNGVKFSIVVFTGLLAWFGINSHNKEITVREFVELPNTPGYSDLADQINETSVRIIEPIPNSEIIIPLIIAGSVLFLIFFSRKK